MKATPELEGWEDWLAHFLQTLTPEERMAGLAPQQIAALLAPQDRIAGLAPQEIAALLAPQDRVAGLAPQDRVAGLAPQDRVAGLSREELILALPDDLLRLQPESVIASLSLDAQARVRTRLGG